MWLAAARHSRIWPHVAQELVAVQVVADALATVVLLDANYRPLRMPGFFKQAIEKYRAA